jgi:hypothetical protein
MDCGGALAQTGVIDLDVDKSNETIAKSESSLRVFGKENNEQEKPKENSDTSFIKLPKDENINDFPHTSDFAEIVSSNNTEKSGNIIEKSNSQNYSFVKENQEAEEDLDSLSNSILTVQENNKNELDLMELENPPDLKNVSDYRTDFNNSKRSYLTAARVLFGVICIILASVAIFYFNRARFYYSEIQRLSASETYYKNLHATLATDYELQKSRITELENQSTTLRAKNNVLNQRLKNLKYQVGKTTDSTDAEEFDKGYVMFFDVQQPVLIESVYIKGKETGEIKIKLYDLNNSLIQESNSININTPQQWQKVTLNFSVKDKGKYYLAFEGAPNLMYNSSGFDYNKDEAKNLLKITGSGPNAQSVGQKYYKYFYDWQISPLAE